jgi:ribA/ribD-fused uncharacterized protein
MTINFYKLKDPYGDFGNFSPHPFELKGKVWLTSEHYFQAMKFEGTYHEDDIRASPGPWAAAKEGRRRDRPLREDWEEVKEDIMYEALQAKFDRYPELKELLLSTEDATLVEDSPIDSYWGCGKNRKGQNRLGVLLMKLRDEYKGQDNG